MNDVEFFTFLVLQRLRESEDPRFKEVSTEIEALLAEGTEFSDPSLCALVVQENFEASFEVIKDLLNKGVDVDKTDYCGRTALVCPLQLHNIII